MCDMGHNISWNFHTLVEYDRAVKIPTIKVGDRHVESRR